MKWRRIIPSFLQRARDAVGNHSAFRRGSPQSDIQTNISTSSPSDNSQSSHLDSEEVLGISRAPLTSLPPRYAARPGVRPRPLVRSPSWERRRHAQTADTLVRLRQYPVRPNPSVSDVTPAGLVNVRGPDAPPSCVLSVLSLERSEDDEGEHISLAAVEDERTVLSPDFEDVRAIQYVSRCGIRGVMLIPGLSVSIARS
ncbi:hypothetical protein FA95DRAFT_1562556 [Auriscalpium vulgare]|uniref:Uncharacterized protein n=1 Tax=Auriscalpium vulgare TaxID=40419 RepID=A0ACB8RJL4_9AGAM|nr:hypothetical protein FA95DRAFT_1562556 [Auriscalpium vulgare]